MSIYMDILVPVVHLGGQTLKNFRQVPAMPASSSFNKVSSVVSRSARSWLEKLGQNGHKHVYREREQSKKNAK